MQCKSAIIFTKITVFCLTICWLHSKLSAQEIYFSGLFTLGRIDLEDCSIDLIYGTGLPGGGINDIAFHPDGNLYIINDNSLFYYDFLIQAYVLIGSFQVNIKMNSLVSDANGNLYGAGINFPANDKGYLYLIDINTGVAQNLGELPIPPAGDLVFYEGKMYMSGFDISSPAQQFWVEVNIQSPENSVVLGPLTSPSSVPMLGLVGYTTSCDSTLLLGSLNNRLVEIDVENLTATVFCQIGPSMTGLTMETDFIASTCVNCLFFGDPAEIALCEGESYTVGSNTYTQSGTYVDTLQGSNGCDTVVTTVLTILPAVNVVAETLSICEGSSTQLHAQGAQIYSWSPSVGLSDTSIANPIASPAQTTTYIVTGTSETDNLIVNGDFEQGNTGFVSSYTYSPTDIGPQSVYSLPTNVIDVHPLAYPCTDHTSGMGKLMAVNGAGVPNTTVWQQTIAIQPNTDYIFSAWVINWSSIQSNLSNLQFSINGQLLGNVFQPLPQQCEWKQFYIIWNSGIATSAVIRLVNQNLDVFGNDFGLDDIRFSRLCTTTDTVTVVVHPNVQLSQAPAICQDDTLMVGNNAYYQSGTYVDSLQTTNGCDSVVTTVLAVLPASSLNQAITICEGEDFPVGDSIYIQSGTYVNTLQAFNGCDSLLTTVLTVLPKASFSQIITICQGDSIQVGSSEYGQSGTFLDTLLSANGCDSLVTTMLTVLLNATYFQNPTICAGDSLDVGGSKYGQTGTYLDTLTAANGCDSIVTTALTVLAVSSFSQAVTICDGEGFAVDNSIYTQSGIYVDTLEAANGCDSIVTTVLTVLAVPTFSQTVSICEGESFTVDTSVYTQSGTYVDTLEAANGCDSIVTTALTVLAVPTFSQAVSICDGESFAVDNSIYTQSGIYVDTLKAANGCDSIVTTALTVLPNISTNLSETICEGEFFKVGNSQYYQTGFYSDTLGSVIGCDSIVNLALQVATLHANLELNDPTCFGEMNGSAAVTQTSGGMPPFVFALNDTAFFSFDTLFVNLDGGGHLLWMEDANGCRQSFPFFLNEPVELNLSISTELSIELGEQQQLLPELNFLPDSIMWSPADGLSCTDCLRPFAQPMQTTVYHLWIQDANGCSVEGEIRLSVRKSLKVFVPNAFSPNGDGINDVLTVFADKSISRVIEFHIFNRWGGHVFEAQNFSPNESSMGWDGTFKGKPVDTAVFAWFAIVEFVNGDREVLEGDVSVIR